MLALGIYSTIFMDYNHLELPAGGLEQVYTLASKNPH